MRFSEPRHSDPTHGAFAPLLPRKDQGDGSLFQFWNSFSGRKSKGPDRTPDRTLFIMQFSDRILLEFVADRGCFDLGLVAQHQSE